MNRRSGGGSCVVGGAGRLQKLIPRTTSPHDSPLARESFIYYYCGRTSKPVSSRLELEFEAELLQIRIPPSLPRHAGLRFWNVDHWIPQRTFHTHSAEMLLVHDCFSFLATSAGLHRDGLVEGFECRLVPWTNA